MIYNVENVEYKSHSLFSPDFCSAALKWKERRWKTRRWKMRKRFSHFSVRASRRQKAIVCNPQLFLLFLSSHIISSLSYFLCDFCSDGSFQTLSVWHIKEKWYLLKPICWTDSFLLLIFSVVSARPRPLSSLPLHLLLFPTFLSSRPLSHVLPFYFFAFFPSIFPSLWPSMGSEEVRSSPNCILKSI